MDIVELLAFVLGGVIAALLYLQLKVPPVWAMLAGFTFYLVSVFLVQFLLFGRIG